MRCPMCASKNLRAGYCTRRKYGGILSLFECRDCHKQFDSYEKGEIQTVVVEIKFHLDDDEWTPLSNSFYTITLDEYNKHLDVDNLESSHLNIVRGI
jgi:transcriptional regulator NrdR family protein